MDHIPREVASTMGERVAAFASEHRVPGISFGVVVGARLVHAGGVGAVRLGDRTERRPGTATRSRICSMTKSFVATAVVRLRDEGALTLEDHVEDHVPQLAGRLRPPTADAPPITIRDLLTMASGLPTDDPWADRHLDAEAEWVDALFSRGFTFSRPPRTGYEYSNLGWVILGRVIRTVTGSSAQRYVSTSVVEPLGLESTGWDVPEGLDVMSGYRWLDDRWLEEADPLGDGDFAPMGGLWSTVADLARWVAFFLDAFPPRDDPDEGPLRRSSRREMQQAHRAFPSSYDPATGRLDAGGYGYGLVVTHDLRFGHLVHHAGGLPGFGSHMAWVPGRGVGAVALGNATYAPVAQLTRELLELLVDAAPTPPPTPSPVLVDAAGDLARLLSGWDDAGADGLFASNVFLDDPPERRRAEQERVRMAIGPFRAGPVEALSVTSGTFRLDGDRGTAEVTFALTPEVPPRVQSYRVEVAAPADGSETAPVGPSVDGTP